MSSSVRCDGVDIPGTKSKGGASLAPKTLEQMLAAVHYRDLVDVPVLIILTSDLGRDICRRIIALEDAEVARHG